MRYRMFQVQVGHRSSLLDRINYVNKLFMAIIIMDEHEVINKCLLLQGCSQILKNARARLDDPTARTDIPTKTRQEFKQALAT